MHIAEDAYVNEKRCSAVARHRDLRAVYSERVLNSELEVPRVELPLHKGSVHAPFRMRRCHVKGKTLVPFLIAEMVPRDMNEIEHHAYAP